MNKSYTVQDHRKSDTRPTSEVQQWIIATDKFMSGWGMAPGRSLVAYPYDVISLNAAADLYQWMQERTDYIRVRTARDLPRMRDGDHLSIYDVPERFKE